MPKTNINVKLSGEDGNAYSIIGKVKKALIKGGHPDLAEDFQTEAMSGDYDHLLQTAMDYVEVE